MENFKKYFLGANSCESFVSHFGDCYLAEQGYNVYIIKGGPGTGKSSLLKRIGAKALDKGLTVDLCPCSSDPDSLDGLILPQLKTVLLDGTAPHVVEPKYPGVCEELVNLGEFWDSKKLKANKEKIMLASAENKLYHKKASAYLSALGVIMRENLALQRDATDIKKVTSFTDALCKKYLKPKGFYGTEQVRFLSAVTPKGVVSFPKTIESSCKTMVIIKDNKGFVASLVCEAFRKNALSCGYDIISYKSPFLPSLIYEHIVIPELSLAVVCENSYISFDTKLRRIHSRRFTDNNVLSRFKNHLLFNKKMGTELLKGAVSTLRLALASHDKLESFYIDAMDFSKTEILTSELEQKIFKNC